MNELHQRGFHDVIFETDAQNIVYAIRHRNTGVSEFSSIIHKIKCMLSLNSGFEVKLIRRQANRIARTIARASLSWFCRHIFYSILSCINNLLYNETIRVSFCQKKKKEYRDQFDNLRIRDLSEISIKSRTYLRVSYRVRD
jgi:hypothetical protein